MILPAFWCITYFAGLAVAVALLVFLARRTGLLRDRGEAVAEGSLAPYSLARFQLAFWCLLVMAAYTFIWMITGELDTITGSVLALLGIGSGTALGAAMIDQGKEEARRPRMPRRRPPLRSRHCGAAAGQAGEAAQERGDAGVPQGRSLSDEQGSASTASSSSSGAGAGRDLLHRGLRQARDAQFSATLSA